MKKLGLLLAMSVLGLVSFAQKAEITFDKTVHDFGKVAEEIGKAECEFVFTNIGNAPLVLNRVTASCGCTTPSWTKEPIAPGAKGSIKVSYSAAGRPGTFNKNVTVTSNAGKTPTVSLRIAGEVLARGSAPYEIPAGESLSLRTAAVQFAHVTNGKTVSASIDIMNNGTGSIKPVVAKLPPYLSCTVSPAEFARNARGKLTFTFNAAAYGKWGAFSETLPILINGSTVKITFSGNVVEDFSGVDRKTAPNYQAETGSIALGTVKAGSSKTFKYKISNAGTKPLIFRSISNKSPELLIKEPKAINGAKSDFLNVTLNTKGLASGSYKAAFALQTNDPDHSLVPVEVEYQVVK